MWQQSFKSFCVLSGCMCPPSTAWGIHHNQSQYQSSGHVQYTCKTHSYSDVGFVYYVGQAQSKIGLLGKLMSSSSKAFFLSFSKVVFLLCHLPVRLNSYDVFFRKLPNLAKFRVLRLNSEQNNLESIISYIDQRN